MTSEIKRVTDLYCEGIKDPITYAGTLQEFEEVREGARRRGGSQGMSAYVLRWRTDGDDQVVLDLNRTRILAMVERRVS